LAGELLGLVKMGAGELIITTPPNLVDDTLVSVAINYKLNDTVSVYTQELSVEFIAPDLCNDAMIFGPDGVYESFFAFEQDVDVTEYYRIGMFSTNVTTSDCGPFNYTIDPVCSKFISVAEDLSTNELVFTYNQPKDVEWRVGIV
jgi:hypothetical protein